MMLRGFFICLFAVCISVCDLKAQEVPLSDFVETDAPKLNSKEWYKLDLCNKNFRVENDHGKLKISLWRPPQEKDTLKVADGMLVGIDNGEFGGRLVYISDKTHKTTVVKDGNIHLLFKYENDIYFIDALAHMGYNKGALYKLNFFAGEYTNRKILDFEDAPQSFYIYNNDLLIGSFSGFYRVHNLQKETLFKDEFWWGLYASSITAIDDRHVYMGFTGGYIKIDLIDKRFVFYQYKYL